MSAYDPEVLQGYWRYMFYLAGGLLAVCLVTGEWCTYGGVYAAVGVFLYLFASATAGK
jgi:hypothetical protein